MNSVLSTAAVAALLFTVLLLGCVPAAGEPDGNAAERSALWVNALRGEPLSTGEVLDDLQRARVIYLGEYHSVTRHHALAQEILEGLARRGVRLVLAMEQFEWFAQPALDRFNAGTIDLQTLVKETELAKRWRNHTNYHGLLAAARRLEIPVLALNARAETIRAVGRQGLAKLPTEQRSELPETLVTEDPKYERLLNRLLSVHRAFDPEKLRPVFEAQVARDETMASRLAGFLGTAAGENRSAVVICGRGHCEFGLGTPVRVARRMPGVSQRIILLSESGDLHLTPEEREQAREIEIPHEFLQEMGLPPGDYFHVTQRRPGAD